MQEPLDMEADFGIKVDKLCDYSDCSLNNNGFKEYDAKDNGKDQKHQANDTDCYDEGS